MKYLKTWMGVTSGSHLGYSDGYPERKFTEVNSLDDLVKGYDESAEYYKLEKVDVKSIVEAVKGFNDE